MQWLVKFILVCGLISSSLAQISPGVCEGVQDLNYIASTENCNWYYQCIRNVAYRLSCSYGLHFSQAAQTCVIPERANCAVLEITPETPTGPPPPPSECTGVQNGQLIPNINSCLSYFECIDQLPYPRFCADGLWFDMFLLTCGPPENVNCAVYATTTEGIPTVPTVPTASPNDPLCLEARNDTWVNDPLKCEGFFHCINGQTQERICPDGLWFNFAQQRCAQKYDVICTLDSSICADFDEFVLIRSAFSCSDIIVCESGTFIEAFFCRDGFWFDQERQVCDQIANVDCDIEPRPTSTPRSVCDGILDYLLARSPVSCSEYYVCVNNEPRHALTCPEGQWFDVISQACQDSAILTCQIK